MKIGIIGSGNVSWHLARGLKNLTEIELCWISGRNKESLKALASSVEVNAFDFIPVDVDLILICVNDDNIQTVLNQVSPKIPVAYTSGTVSLEKLNFEGKLGVFYPLQTFTKGRQIDLEKVPFLIESNDDELRSTLTKLASMLSTNVQLMNSEDRKNIHIAAVFANNFVNHMLYLSSDLLSQKNLPFEILSPLIEETIKKAIELNPKDAQSGPARRSDTSTINMHLNELDERKKNIYDIVTKSILETYKK